MTNTRTQIMDALLALGEQKGLSNVSLSDIASSIGIRKASIYSHFKSQQEIVDCTLSHCQEVLRTKDFKVDFKARDAQSLLVSLLNSFLQTFTEPPLSSYFSIVQQQRMFDPVFASHHQRLTAMIGARVRVALEYCQQRSWLYMKDTDIASDLFTSSITECLCEVIVNPEDADWRLDRLVDGLLVLFSLRS